MRIPLGVQDVLLHGFRAVAAGFAVITVEGAEKMVYPVVLKYLR